MNGKIFGLIVAFILFGVVLGFTGGDETESNEISEAEATNNSLGIDTAALQGPLNISVAGTQGGAPVNVFFTFDGEGNYSSLSTNDGVTAGFRFIDGATYVENTATGIWTRYEPGSESAPTFNPDEFTLSNEAIDALTAGGNIAEIEESTCTAGVCRVWREIDELNNEDSRILIDDATDRLDSIEVTNTLTGEIATITYSYPESVTIEEPFDTVRFEEPLTN